MQREKTLFISRKDNLKYLTDEYRRIYFGDEFCERLLPGEKDLVDVMEHAEQRGIPFTFVTPYVTEAGLKKLEQLIALLPAETEVVFNDWGVLRTVTHKFPDLVPVMGRLLTKIKRGPRIVHFLDKLPKQSAEHLKRTNLDVPVYNRFLREHNIKRADLDNPLQGINLDGIPPELHLSLYIPFAYVTTTRFCLVANCDNPDKKGFIGVFPCNKECQKYTFYLDNAVMTTLLIRRGNTIFYKNTKLPDNIQHSNIDRIVIEPEVPH